jgi:hypothetical protein
MNKFNPMQCFNRNPVDRSFRELPVTQPPQRLQRRTMQGTANNNELWNGMKLEGEMKMKV